MSSCTDIVINNHLTETTGGIIGKTNETTYSTVDFKW